MCVCGWKSRMLQKGEPRRDNIQVLTKAMHAEPSALHNAALHLTAARQRRGQALLRECREENRVQGPREALCRAQGNVLGEVIPH